MLAANGTTEPTILDGLDIGIISGKEQNFKITMLENFVRYKGDIAKARMLHESICLAEEHGIANRG